MDTVDSLTRSRTMRCVPSQNTSAEQLILKAIKLASIKGWRRNYNGLLGRPDIVFPKRKISIFIDGCFWHGCAKCSRKPTSNLTYWRAKILRNRVRDRRNNQLLRKRGWTVIRIWEHDIKSEKKISKLLRILKKEN